MSKNKHLGHQARKRFGQNFLNNDYIIEQIVESIAPSDQYTMVEIGPGLGALTEPVAERISELKVIELDMDLVERLQNHPTLSKKLSIHQGDALKFDFSKLITEDKLMKVFGNLPYNISTPLMFHLFKYVQSIHSMYFMLQKEVVLRLCAGPNHKNYGRLSVMAQYYCQAVPVLEVPPESFVPAPKVDSAVVCLMPYQDHPFPCDDVKTLEEITKKSFHMRRKTLRNNLKNMLNDDDFKELNIDSTKRPEHLSVAEYVKMANLLHHKRTQAL
jgi:16S rRNA (adenine1518-N6/adenine1519-N6)-dimethyltransferase